MNPFLENLDYYIEQYELEKQIFLMGEKIKKRGWLEREEFITICLWKSRRPKRLYDRNSDEDVIRLSKLALNESDELEKIKILTKLSGVRIPTASAILSVVNPKIYPIIDVRCILALNDLGVINWNRITEKNWVLYLDVVREIAMKNNKTAREIEKGLFAYNRIILDKQYSNLYK